MNSFLAAFAVGVAVAAPVGPVGVLCIQRTLRGGISYGIASGLGVATADGLYAALAALGIAAVARAAGALQQPLQAVGGAVLLALAVRAWAAARETCEAAVAPSARGLAGAYASTAVLTLANPTTIMSFAGIMAGLGTGVANPDTGSVFVAGVVAGSAAWWVFLALVIGVARARAPRGLVLWAGRVSALVLGAAGVIAIGSVILSGF